MKKITLITLILLMFYVQLFAQLTPNFFETSDADSIPKIEFRSLKQARSVVSAEPIQWEDVESLPAPSGDSLVVEIEKPAVSFSARAASVSTSYAVGEIPITPGTSLGAATYQVPIEIYPEPMGMQPSLSLNYNSSGGNGELGIGWSLGGISKITRTTKNVHYDGENSGVELTKNDAFLLDGMRLIRQSSSSSEMAYESEQGHIKVVAYLSGSVVKYFKVLYPDGKTGIFGSTSNSTNRTEYLLRSMADLNGNKIAYSYSYRGGHYRISSISYGQNSLGRVTFAYKDERTDILRNYLGGHRYKDYLVASIKCYYGSELLKTYNLTYVNSKDVSQLRQIACSAGGKSLNPLTFSYGTGASLRTERGTVQLGSWYTHNTSVLKVGRFDYTSSSDGLINYPNLNPYYRYRRNSTWFRHSEHYYRNQYDQYADESILVSLNLNYDFTYPQAITIEKGFMDVLIADVDGRNEQEVIKVNHYLSGSYEQLEFKVYTATFMGLGYKYTRTYNYARTLKDNNGNRSVHPRMYYTGDFTGNGKQEVLAVSVYNPLGSKNVSMCYLYDLENDKLLYSGNVFNFVREFSGSDLSGQVAENKSDKLMVIDHDGDGKSDICLINSSGTHIYSFEKSGSSLKCNKKLSYSSLKKETVIDRPILLGEFDGDGLIDILIAPKRGLSTWNFYHSTGTSSGFAGSSHSGISRSSTSDAAKADRFYVQDINGDGISDLIKVGSKN